MIEYYSIHVLFYKARSTGNSPNSYRRGKKHRTTFSHIPPLVECPERRRPVLPSPTRRPDLHPRTTGTSPRAPLDLAPTRRRPDLAHGRRRSDLVPTRAASSPSTMEAAHLPTTAGHGSHADLVPTRTWFPVHVL
jgi:hypothetical protein